MGLFLIESLGSKKAAQGGTAGAAGIAQATIKGLNGRLGKPANR